MTTDLYISATIFAEGDFDRFNLPIFVVGVVIDGA
jgi:hypothetical protein